MDVFERLDKLRDLDFQVMAGRSHKEILAQYEALNYIDVSPETQLFRIFTFKRLKESIHDNRLTLVRPSCWKDPYENFILNSTGRISDGTNISFAPVRDLFYGQCWSMRHECDGLWKAFSSQDTGVKVSAKARKLMHYFYDTTNPFHSLSYFMGLVRYLPDSEIHAYFERKLDWLFRDGGQSLSLLSTLLIKREAFDYEQEVRLLFRLPNSDEIDLSTIDNPWNPNSCLFHFRFDPNAVFEEIVFSPMVDIDKYRAYETDLRTAGYTGPIRRSNLYDKPQFVAKI